MTVKDLYEKIGFPRRWNKINDVIISDLEEKREYKLNTNKYYMEYDVVCFYVRNDYSLIIEAKIDE